MNLSREAGNLHKPSTQIKTVFRQAPKQPCRSHSIVPRVTGEVAAVYVDVVLQIMGRSLDPFG